MALIVLSPAFLVTALAVRSDGGPAFYKQTRVGKNNTHFEMYKFRSMCKNAENLQDDLMKYNEMNGPVFKITERQNNKGLQIYQKNSIRRNLTAFKYC